MLPSNANAMDFLQDVISGIRDILEGKVKEF